MKHVKTYETRTEKPSVVGQYLVSRFLSGTDNIEKIESLETFDTQLGFKQLSIKIVFDQEITGKIFNKINKMLDYLTKNNYTILDWFYINAWVKESLYVSFVINYDQEVEKITEEAEIYLASKKYNL